MTRLRLVLYIISFALLRLAVSTPMVGIPSCFPGYGPVDGQEAFDAVRQLEADVILYRRPEQTIYQFLDNDRGFGLGRNVIAPFRLPQLRGDDGTCLLGIDFARDDPRGILAPSIGLRLSTWRQHLENFHLIRKTCVDFEGFDGVPKGQGGWMRVSAGFYYVIANPQTLLGVRRCLMGGESMKECIDKAAMWNSPFMASQGTSGSDQETELFDASVGFLDLDV
ncbi:hypothetical protein MMC13_001524 [Lambiella insularis]|nr:hypothetical protein [Lambiella insularis]